MTEHTKLPWRVEEGTDLIWGACNADDQTTYGMGYSIVQGHSASYLRGKPDMAEREANAAFIVRACNSHDALVEALDRLTQFIRNATTYEMERAADYSAYLDARAALLAAREVKP